MSVNVWVLYRYKWCGNPKMSVVSKKKWQKEYAGWKKRQLQPPQNPLLTDVEYITESTDKMLLVQMALLAKEE